MGLGDSAGGAQRQSPGKTKSLTEQFSAIKSPTCWSGFLFPPVLPNQFFGKHIDHALNYLHNKKANTMYWLFKE
jgi:hypothetical protein